MAMIDDPVTRSREASLTRIRENMELHIRAAKAALRNQDFPGSADAQAVATLAAGSMIAYTT